MPHHSFMRPPVWHSQQPFSLSPRTVRRPMLMAPALWWAACAVCLPRTADREWRRPVSSTPAVFPSNHLLCFCPLIYYTHTYILLSGSVITFPLFMQMFYRWLFLGRGKCWRNGPAELQKLAGLCRATASDVFFNCRALKSILIPIKSRESLKKKKKTAPWIRIMRYALDVLISWNVPKCVRHTAWFFHGAVGGRLEFEYQPH